MIRIRRPLGAAFSVVALVVPLAAAGPALAGPAGAASGRPVARPLSSPVPGAEEGAYEWDDSTWWPDPSAYAGTLTRLKSLGVNTLYVDITEAVTLIRDHSSELGSFEAAFGQLVTEADADGFSVDAVGGDPAWATSERNGPAQLLSAVAQIVAATPDAPLDGVQFDVEPWGLKTWSSRRTRLIRDWLTFIETTVSTWRSDGLSGRLGFTVPYWFHGNSRTVPRVTFDGAKNYPFQLALGLLSPLPDTALNVMAYRNSTAGSNGSLALFDGNLAAALAAGSTTELLVGQETGVSAPSDTTFYGLTCADFDTATTQIADTFDGDAPYEGIAVDDVESLEALCPA
jgi:hypothetical protein